MGIEFKALQLFLYWIRPFSALGYCNPWTGRRRCAPVGCRRTDWETRDCRGRIGPHRILVGQIAYLSCTGIPGDGISARCAWLARSPSAGGLTRMPTSHLIAQVLNVLAAGLLLISFAMLSRRRT